MLMYKRPMLSSLCHLSSYLSCVIVERKRGGSHLAVRWGVDDVIHRGRGAENRHVSTFEMLDPVAELGSIETRHHYGVDQLPW